MSVMRKFLTVIFSIMFLCNITSSAFSGLNNEELKELEILDEQIKNNPDITESELARWEELLVKDPEVLKRRRQQAINNWKYTAKSQGEQIDEEAVDAQSEQDWNKFLDTKRAYALESNERAAVDFLRNLKIALNNYYQDNAEYPGTLEEVPRVYPKILTKRTFQKVKVAYKFQYQSIGDSFSVLLRPKVLGSTGNKLFFLDNSGVIRFTLDGTIPTPRSYPIF